MNGANKGRRPVEPGTELLHVTRKLFSRALIVAIACFGLVASGSRPADAREQFPGEFSKIYTTLKAGGTVDSAAKACTLCHDAVAGPPKLNPYGASVKSALDKANAKDLTPAVLKSIEDLDSDGDGFSNIEEINADTLPGDPKSHPAGAPKTAAKKVDPSESAEPSPFDIKGIILAKHAQHPIIVHFPIGLFIASLLFDIIARFKKSTALNMAAYYNVVMAAVTGLLSVITGIICWQWKLRGSALEGNLKLHLILGIVTSLLMFVLWAVRKNQVKKPAQAVSIGYLILALITAAVIALTGHVGGILSGVV